MTNDKKIKKSFKIENQAASSLSSFIKRPVPSSAEVDDFEEVIEKEARHLEIDANLNEIYKDKKGGLVDVKRMKIKKRHRLIVRIFRKLLFLVVLLLFAYLAYAYFFTGDSDMGAVKLEIVAPEEVVSGEEFTYYVSYKNPTKFAISQVKMELSYPENFVFSSASLEPRSFNNSFDLESLPAGAESELKITGMLIGEKDSVSVISASLHYIPVNFSSSFKKESSAATVISGFGFDVDMDYPDLAFVGQTSDISFSLAKQSGVNYLSEILLEFGISEGEKITLAEGDYGDAVKTEGDNTFLINLPALGDNQLSFKYQVNNEERELGLPVFLKQRIDSGASYIFFSEVLNIKVVKSDLNISLFLNGEKNSQPVNFGETLNYTLNYSNKGESSYKDAVITAVLDGDLFDFNSLSMDIPGEVRSNQIIWDEQDIANLKEIKPGDEGEINFSINIKPYSDSYNLNQMEVSVYSQYGGDEKLENSDNRSNIISSPLNSNLSLVEEIRYFDENNLPVGSGPLPPQVGEVSQFRVYWRLENSLHELRDARVSLSLPSYVSYVSLAQVDVGDIYYSEESHEVIWEAGRLPASVGTTLASFVISIEPVESDRNKILVLSSGAEVKAIDTFTKETIESTSGPKTTKLEDDDIAALSNSGRIE
jgi:uncharacterized repeat protein (TIGR01451 family)